MTDTFHSYAPDSTWLADSSAFTVLPDTMPAEHYAQQLPPVMNGILVAVVALAICFAVAWSLWSSFTTEDSDER